MEGTVVEPYGLTYRVLRPNEAPDGEPPWSGYTWHTLDAEDAHGEYTAELILGDYWFAKGQEWLLLGKADKAVKAFDKVIEIQGPNAQTLNNLGSACAEYGEYDAAARYYARAVEADPEYATALRNLARAQRQLGRDDALLSTLDKLIALEKADYETYWMRGEALRDLGRADDAIEAFSKLIKYNADDADAYRELGLVYLELKQDREAAQHYLQRSLILNPDQPRLLDSLQSRNLNLEIPGPTPREDVHPPTGPTLPQPPDFPGTPAPNPPIPELPAPAML